MNNGGNTFDCGWEVRAACSSLSLLDEMYGMLTGNEAGTSCGFVSSKCLPQGVCL
jgi:hypothetical protein